MAPLPARKNCGSCRRWRLRIDYRIQTHRGTPRLSSYCNYCHKVKERERAKRLPPEKKIELRETKRIDYFLKTEGTVTRRNKKRPIVPDSKPRRHSLPIGPLRDYLATKVQMYGIGNVAASTSINPRTISMILSGYYWKNGKRYSYSFTQPDMVDRATRAYQENIHDLYPDL